ncbi:MAG: hypothetical protein M1495_12350 [Bacteroidetes bacterium]|nr:hypothetical protein [Bacteroidota bacterium]MCL6096981.1 hypothetical protein [Bacteroidota bacterium]
MKKILIAAVGFVILMITAQAQTNIQTSNADQIKAKLIQWEESFNKRYLKNFGSYYSEDYIGLYPNQPDETFTSTLNEYNRLFQNMFLNIKLNYGIIEIEADNNYGYMRVVQTSEVKPKFAAKSQFAQDTGIIIWKKQNDGEWKIYRSSLFPLVKEKEN